MKRKAITPKMKIQTLLHRVHLECGVCHQRISPTDEIEWDHVWALYAGGTHSFDNLRPLHKQCHRQKTSGTKATSAGSDIHMQAKIDRLTGRTKAKAKRSWPKQTMPGGRNSAWKKPVHGSAVRREGKL